MMTEEGALRRAVCVNPYDHTPRLAYADWLMENDPGRTEYAEYVKYAVDVVQLNQEMLDCDDDVAELSKRFQLAAEQMNMRLGAYHVDREYRLREVNPTIGVVQTITEHFAPFAGFALQWQTRSWPSFLRLAPAVFRTQPVLGVEVQSYNPERLRPQQPAAGSYNTYWWYCADRLPRAPRQHQVDRLVFKWFARRKEPLKGVTLVDDAACSHNVDDLHKLVSDACVDLGRSLAGLPLLFHT